MDDAKLLRAMGWSEAQIAGATRQGKPIQTRPTNKLPPARRDLADSFMALWQRHGPADYPAVREFRFHPSRRWRFDAAFPPQKVAVELEGGIWTLGRHSRGKGMRRDMAKYNSATQMGWAILRFCVNDLEADPLGVVAQVHNLLLVRLP
jgi:very-short-patch-repair endonuclease